MDYNVDLPRLLVTVEEARRTAIEPGTLSALLLRHGGVELRWYAPTMPDPQAAHDRDEFYVVVSGTSVFVRAEERHPFGEDPPLPPPAEERAFVQPGDALFVPAGTAHRFESASADFGAWAVFYGPEGGSE